MCFAGLRAVGKPFPTSFRYDFSCHSILESPIERFLAAFARTSLTARNRDLTAGYSSASDAARKDTTP